MLSLFLPATNKGYRWMDRRSDGRTHPLKKLVGLLCGFGSSRGRVTGVRAGVMDGQGLGLGWAEYRTCQNNFSPNFF